MLFLHQHHSASTALVLLRRHTGLIYITLTSVIALARTEKRWDLDLLYVALLYRDNVCVRLSCAPCHRACILIPTMRTAKRLIIKVTHLGPSDESTDDAPATTRTSQSTSLSLFTANCFKMAEEEDFSALPLTDRWVHKVDRSPAHGGGPSSLSQG